MAICLNPTPEQQQQQQQETQAAQLSTAPTATGQEPMTIPLDAPATPKVRRIVRTLSSDDEDEATSRKPRLRRDSMRRREALQKGNEGSRRRQRWENDNFLNHPSYTPPNPSDYYPQPLHPTRVVRYEFATLWDPSNPAKFGYGTAHHVPNSKDKEAEKRVPKNLKDRLKRSKGAMDLLKSLEEEVRRYAASLWGCTDDEYNHAAALIKPHAAGEEGGVKLDADGDQMMSESIVVEEELKDSEDEEIVFIPRMKTVTLLDENAEEPVSPERPGAKLQIVQKREREEIYIPVLGPPLQKSVFEAPQEDQSASFGRWLVHSIALYYGLRSWSVTQGSPAMRIAFVGAQPSEKKKRKSGAIIKHPKALPRPLWMML